MGALAVVVLARVAALAGHDIEWNAWAPMAYLWQDAATLLAFAVIDRNVAFHSRWAWAIYAAFVAYIVINVPAQLVMSTPMTWTMWRAAGGAIGDSIWSYATAPNLLWIAAVVAAAIVAPVAVFRRRDGGVDGDIGSTRSNEGTKANGAGCAVRRVGLQRRPTSAADRIARTSDAQEPHASFVRAIRSAARVASRRPSNRQSPFVSVAPFLRCVPVASVTSVIGAGVMLVVLGPAAVRRVDTNGLERNAWSALVVSALPRVTAAETSALDYRRPHATDAAGPREDLARFRGIAAGRNVILVSLESTAAQYLGVYGAQPDVAPNLSTLARTGLIFDNAYAPYPESIKGLNAILCGTHPAFGVSAEDTAALPCRSIAATLSQRGYRTALFHSGRFAYLGMGAVIRDRGFDVLADAGDIGGNHESSFGVDDRSTAGRVLDWIDSLPRGGPFFVTYLPIAGHHPYEAPEPGPFPDRDEFGRYRNALRYSDDVLGSLMRGLEERGLDRDTLWIVLGDHGEAFGQHDANFGHTFQLYEENVHVPLLVSAPGVIQGAIRSRRVVSLVDTAPTLLDLLGLDASETGSHARSALDPEPRMALFFADYSLGLLGLRDGRRKFIYEIESKRARLFDLDRDPGETVNLADRDPGRTSWYRDRLKAWIAAPQL